MRHLPSLLFVYLLFILTAFFYPQTQPYFPTSAAEAGQATYQIKSAEGDLASPNISASSYLVFDLETAQVLLEHNPDHVLPIASVTKLFTATALVQKYSLDATTTITWSDLATEGEAGKLRFGQTYSYRELLFPLLLESSNDASSALVRATNYSLVSLMNEFVKNNGANKTTFFDASGLDERNVSTAIELASLVRVVNIQERYIFNITELPQYIGPYTGWLNNNPVHTFSGYRGGKHGYTVAANRTLVALLDQQFTTEKRTLGYILLGSENLQSDVTNLRSFITNSVDYK
ncbi:hypothetical protein CO026_01440 [Candidatus Kaiserbacteria bacterium CG_4_9_14_0_2_um_filter_41_32]|uniref:Peptidase S11 D-alanyl-D-alanine carboxypeptidase A N-terminal domain-containing protein n=1 Tax=Candidatus Kaiserbacteria bacterium CG_4_9_14_0_2_um_filter_41_32 TaxID=1974601 RepID=A0A2M8FF08_9BACT|nr:MAG: hypothetical protein CO026_01440 [Candidatus Kaiserbacteria bacterium CG_4_9_14_0_2_um_filter_41_32]